jgi:antitoxin component YwqK of YwqJK toxin-antitoxin module/tetratricopeptide (TPR) repeat protein
MTFPFRHCIAVIFLLSTFFASYSQNQQKINSAALIKQGTELYNNDKYKEAIAVYNKVPRSDTNYSTVLFNLSLAHYADSNFAESKKLAEQGLKDFPEKSDDWYNLIANNLDKQGKTDEALAFYDKMINTFQYQYLAWYNKGITYYNQKKMAEARKCLQQSLLINPYYSPAHFFLGNIAYDEGNTVAAMLSYSTSLLVNPTNKYSNSSIKMLSNISKVTDEVSKKASLLKPSSTDNFDVIQEIVLSKIALDKQYKLKADLEDPIVRQLQVIFEKLEYAESDKGFWMQYYVPMYTRILKNNQYEPFIFYIFSSLKVPEIEHYVKKNNKMLESMEGSFITYLSDIRATETLSVAERKNVTAKFQFGNGAAWGKGKVEGEGDKAMLTGAWEFYFDNGRLKSKGSFNQKEEKIGEWMFYYPNGVLKEKTNYKDGKPEGKSQEWYDNGLLASESEYKSGEIEGRFIEYYFNGLVKKIENYRQGKKDGAAKVFTSYNTLDYTTNYKDDKEDGEETIYYKNGKVSSISSYKNGELAGAFKSFYENGSVRQEGNFIGGKRSGTWKDYYNNGKVKSTYNYEAGAMNGSYKDFYDNGKPMIATTYLNGKIDGRYEDFDNDGAIYSTSVYQKGNLKELKFIDKTGKVISNISRSGGGNLVFYDANGNKTSEGYFTKDGLRSGKSTFYYSNGKASEMASYKDGMLDGEKIVYFLNGTIAQKEQYKEDEQNGYQVSYYENGQLKHEGEVIKGLNEGLHIDYNEFGQIVSKTNYKDGDIDGYAEYYHPSGKKDYEMKYLKGWPMTMTQFDTLGNVIADVTLPAGEGDLAFKTYQGRNFITASYKNYYINGSHELLYPDGKTHELLYYKTGVKDSTVRSYYLNGKVEYEGKYTADERDGKWSYYYDNGQLRSSEEHSDGSLNGISTAYNEDGSLDKEFIYKDGELDGEFKMYGEDKQLAVIFTYKSGKFISYTYEDKNGKLVPSIPVKNGKGAITAFYKNGTKSVEMDFEGDEVNGKRNIFFTSGKPYVQGARLLGYEHGNKKIYYANGQLYRDENYYYGNLHGTVKKYWDNGKLKSEENWYNGEQHGVTKNYDQSGKLTQTLTYYFGSLQTIN